MKFKKYIYILISMLILASELYAQQPIASVSPDSLNATIVACDDSVTLPLTIYNTGTADLNYNINAAFVSSPSGYCVPVYTYCCPEGCGDGDIINNFTFNTLSNLNSNCNGQASGYIHYTSDQFTTTVLPGGTYSVTMQAGSWSEGFAIWIDYNRDGDFNDANEYVYSSPSTSTSQFSTSITIPSNATFGKTRLRIRCAYSTLLTGADTCSSFTYGECEDYDISIGYPFISVTPTTGTIIPGDSAIVMVKFKSAGLFAGNYLNMLSISTNDTLSPIINIPCFLNFIGIPEMLVSSTNLSFDTIMQGAIKKDTIIITNVGCADLIINDITNLFTAFSVNTTNLVIPPGESSNIIATFNPQSLGHFYDTLNVVNNDNNIKIALHGYASEPPVASYNPQSFDVNINTCNETVILPLSISNSGTFPLNWSLSSSVDKSLAFDGNDYVSIANTGTLPTGSVMTVEAWIYPTSYSDASYNGVVSFGPRWCTGSSFLLSMTNAGRPSFASWCNDFVPSSGPSAVLNTWNHIAAVLNGKSLTLYLNGYSWTTTLGSAPNVQNGACNIGCTDSPGRYFNGRIDEVRIWNTARTSADILNNQNKSIDPTQSGLKAYFKFNEGTGNILTDFTGNAHTGTIIGSVYSFTSPMSNLITIGTPSGSVITGDTVAVNITFNPNNLIAGNYTQNIIFTSNDPLHSSDTIECNIHYNGYPIILLSDSCLAFDSLMQYTAINDTILVSNTGCDTLKITGITSTSTSFTVSDSVFSILPGESYSLIVTFRPLGFGLYKDTLHIFSNDSDIDICLNGYSFYPPIYSHFPNTLTATVNVCNDSTTVPLTIYNTGNHDLIYYINNSTLLSAQCTPITTGYCCGMGIYNVKFNTIDNTTPDGSQSYKDYSATQKTLLLPGETYNLYVRTGTSYNENVSAWIDYNNNGMFEAGEQILASLNGYVNHNANVTIPSNAVMNIPLRMRIISEYYWNSVPQPCNNVQYGQCEDYSVTIGTKITFTNNNDTIVQNDSSIVNVTFYTDNLISGVYNGNILVETNDPLIPSDTITYSLILNGYPIISLSDLCIQYDSIMQFSTKSDSVWVKNLGCDTLIVSDIISNTSHFTVDTTYFKIAPTDSALLRVYFSPYITGNIYDTLQILNNDSILKICLHGYAYLPPVISFLPDSFDVTINTCNDTIILPLTIYNTGDTTLTYNISSQNDGNALQFDGVNDYTDMGSWFNYQTFTIELWVNPGSTQQTYADIFDNNHTGTRSFVLQQNGSTTNQYGWGTNDGGGTIWFNLTANQWSHIAITRDESTKTNKLYINGALVSSNTGTGNIPYDGTQFLRFGRWGGGGRYWNGKMDEVRIWNSVKTQVQIQQRMNNQLYGGEPGLIAYWSFNEGTGNTLNDISGNGKTGNNIGASWIIDQPLLNTFVEINPNSGSIIAGDSSIINVSITSFDLLTGNYNTNIIISSNDPLNLSDTILVNLHINGYPVISTSANCIEFDSILQFNSKTESFWIINSGCDSLFVTDIINLSPYFNVDTTNLTVMAGDSAQIFVTFHPLISGELIDTLLIVSNDINKKICLHGYALSPPVYTHYPDTLTAIVNVCNDSLVIPLTIYNSGYYDLIYSINDRPILPALCTPLTTGYCCGMGIYNVKFNTIDNTTADGSQGYKDYSATQKTLLIPGETYNIYVRTGSSYYEHVSAWIDYNNNGVFESGEKILASVNEFINHSANVTIPSNAVMNIPLRMRIISEYSGYGTPQSCNNVQYGQCEDYAVTIGNKVTFDNNNDTIVQNDSLIVNVTFYTDNLVSGVYNGNFFIETNDPLIPIDSIFYSLELNGYPIISPSINCLEFDSIFEFSSTLDTIWFYNLGCDSLHISDITNLNSAFSVDTTLLNIFPGDSAMIVAAFNPTTVGDIYDTLHVINNDSIINICLHGYSLSPPVISFNPSTISVTLNNCNDSITVPLTIYNTGDNDLVYNIHNTSSSGYFIAEYYYPLSGSSPSFGPLVFTDNIQYINTNWGNGGPGNGVGDNNFQVKYKGKIFAETSGTYNFRSYTDDGVRLYIDNQLIINSWYDMAPTSNYGSINLNYGLHDLEMHYYEDGGGANASLYWTQPGKSEELVSASISYTSAIPSVNDTIIPGDSTVIDITFYSNGFITGTYNANLIVNSNDPINTIDTIPYSLTLNGYPVFSLSDTCLIFDSIVQFQSTTKNLTIYNTGCDTLFISNIITDLPEFTTNDTLITILNGDSAIISVQFSPLTVGDFNGTLSILSNTTTENVCLKGVSLSPPKISFNPNSLSANITACNDTFSTPLTIYNVGDYNLVYSVGGSSILSPLCTPITTSNCCGIGITTVQFNTINNITADGSQSYKDYSSTFQTSLQPGTTYHVYVKTGTIYAENVRIWIDYNNNGIFEASEKAFESANKMTNHNGTITIPTTAALQTPLRMRVGSELATNPMPQPCTNVQYGQFEDYKVTIGNGISYTNAIDTVLPNDSSIVMVNLNALQATPGNFTYNVIISSNDPLSPIDTIPFIISIDPLPAKPVATDVQICFGAATPDLIATGTNVEWYSDPALTININSGNTFTTGETAVGQYDYYVTQTINNCSGPSDTVSLSINPVYNSTDNHTICNGDTYIFGTQTLTTSGVYNETFQTVNGCDSIVTLTLTVNPVYSVNDAATICNGDSYILGTQTLTTSGVYVETLQTVNGCDSVVTFTLTVNPTYNLTDSTSITCGQTYTFGTQSLTAAGVYIETFQTVNSCDSVVTLTLTMIPTYTVTDNVTICDGDVYSFGTQNLTVAGTYNETFTAQDGCDSLVILTLNVNPVFATTDSVSITCGQTYTFGTQSLTVAGVYLETFSSVMGCDSVVTLSLYMIPSYNTTDSVAICNGSSYIFGTQTLTTAGIYTETFTAGDGCDSLVTLTLALKPTFATTDVAEICNGNSFTFGTQTLTTAGIYNETFTAINGCDSVVTLTLTVNPTYNLTDNASICDGASYTFGTQTLTIAGDYTETFSSINGCDSTVTLTLTINPVFAEIDSATICDGDVFVFGTQTLSSAGSYNETFASVNGCDSVVTLTLTVNPTFATNDSATICDGDSYVFGTQTLTTAGIYNEIFAAVNGCDSTVTFTLNVNPVYSEVDSASITCGNSFTFGTQTLTTAGVYVETFSSINNCDSVVTLTLSMIPSYTSTDSATICDGDSYIFGTQTLTVAGVYNETFSAVDGCDSLVTFTLNVNPVYNLTDNASICDGGSYTFGTQTLTATGVYTETFATINGCDSVVTLNFTVNPNFTTTDSLGICDGDSYIFETQTLTATGVYNETFSTVSGCDSLVTLTLTVNPIYSVTDSVAICDGDSYVFGTQTLTSTGVYNETFSSIYGCDSVVTLTFYVNPVYSELDTASIVCGGSYNFGTQTLTSAGNYIETFSTVNGCDSVVNLTLLMIPSYTTTDSIAICDGNSFIFGTQTLTVSGQYSETFTAIDGCDSLVNLTLNVNPIFSETDSISITCGQTYNFGTQSITSAGVYTETFSTVYGCDSIVTLTVYMIPFYNVNDTVSICQGDSYSFGSQTLTLAGDYTETFTAVDGCDSLVNLNLVIKFPTVGNDAASICDGDSYIFGTQTLTLAGTYNETFVGSNGCDSVVTLILTVNPAYANTDSNAICDGNSMIFGTQTLSTAGVYTETFSTVYGCDSVVTLTLTVNPVFATTDVATICDGDSIIFGTQTLAAAGVYTETFMSELGCDSVVTLTLSVNPAYNISIVDSINCGGSYVLGTQTLTNAGTYTEVFATTLGCDSVVNLTLNMIPEFTITDSATICSNDSVYFGNQYLSIAGVYNFTFSAVDGCDSLVTFTLNVNPSYSVSITDSISCGGSYTLGTQTLTLAGTYVEPFATANGCDSIVTLNLSVIPAYTNFDAVTICDGDSFVFGTQTLTYAGVYNETFVASDGCDSLVSLTLSVNPSYSDTINASINCGDSYLFAGQNLSIAGTYYDSLLTTLGCDSVKVLNLSINPEFSVSVPAEICDGDSLIFGTQTLTTAGTYLETFTAIDGCDSLVILNLFILPVYNFSDNATICAGDSLIFGSQTLSLQGVYTETFISSFGCDSTVTLTLTVNPISETTITDSISCGGSYLFAGQTITVAGTYYDTLMAANGCDSIVTLNLSMIPSFVTTDTGIICDGDTYVFGTQNLTIAGVYNETFVASNGCDSLVTLTLTVKPTPLTDILDSISCGETYSFAGQTLSVAGVYYDTLNAVNGCDSIVTLYLAMRPSFITSLADTICDGEYLMFGNDTLTIQGVYNHTLTAINGCDSLVTLTLTVTPLPATPIVADLSKCTGTVLPTFAFMGTNVNWYADSMLVILLQSGNSFTPTDSVAGTYNYYVTQSENGCTSLYETATLEIYQTPSAPISSNSGVCYGKANPIMFASGDNICWYSDMMLTDTLALGNSYQSSEVNVGTYTYYITQSSASCGVSAYTQVVFEISNPAPAPLADDVTVCFGEQVPDLTVLPPSSNVLWYSEPELVILVNSGLNFTTGNTNVGEYTYYIVQDYNGCISSVGNVTLTINPKPLVTLDKYNVNINKGDSVIINAFNADSYSWSPSLGLNNTTGSQVIAKPENSITYVVSGTNSYGCTDTASCHIEVGQIGVEEASFAESVSVYPNPVSSKLTIEYHSSFRDVLKINIYNTLNQIIFSKEVVAENGNLIEIIDFDNLPDALYNLQIIKDNSVVNKKIVLKH